MPVVVIGRRDVGPPAACQGADDAGDGDGLREGAAGFRCEEVPQADERKSWPWRASSAMLPEQRAAGREGGARGGRTGRDGDEDHEEGALGVAVANGGRDGGEPLVGVAIPLVLDDLVVVQRGADDEGAEEGDCDGVNMSVNISISMRRRGWARACPAMDEGCYPR